MTNTVPTTFRARLKAVAIVLLLSGTVFAATGCYDDPYYYGQRGVRAGYYASYGGPGPYYGGYDPYGYGYGYPGYGYGYGYGTGIGIGVASYRSYPGYYRRPYYRRGYYGRSGYNNRRYYGRGDWNRRGGGRNWERRDGGGGQRRGRGDRNRGERRTTAVEQQSGALIAAQ